MSKNYVLVKYVMAVLKWPSKLSDQTQKARDICKGITDNPTYFPIPNPPIATVEAAITDVEDAMSAVKNRTAKAAGRKAASAVLKVFVRKQVSFVQGVADNDTANAEVIIGAAGLNVKITANRQAQVFGVKNGLSGEVLLTAAVIDGRGFHEWRMEKPYEPGPVPPPTPQPIVWVSLPTTLTAKTSVYSLPIGRTLQFMHRAVVKNVAGDWEGPISIFVS